MPVTTDMRAYRLASLDMLRGLVLVIMALDHVRDFTMVAGTIDPMASGADISVPLYVTRWITHFCAPVFVFLAGTSAGLMTARRTPGELARFLATRGLWLLVVEWFVMSTAFTFAPLGLPQLNGLILVGMQVIWAIGASLVVLAGAQFLGRRACLAIGVAVVLGHNLLDPIWPVSNAFNTSAPVWVALHAQTAAVVGPFFVEFLYPLLPWTGVMLLGFGASALFEAPPARRDRRLAAWGIGLTTAFAALRLTGVYGDPNPWQPQPGAGRTLLDILNTTKYPPSLLFLLMTLGPSAVLAAWADRVPAAIRQPLVTFGRVPFAFYVTHFYLVHVIAIVLGTAQGFDPREFFTFVFFFPKGYGLHLPGVYVVWVLLVLVLYPFCRWVNALKARRRDWWLSYV
jgi:uncharacterized membrane protein